MRSVAHGFLTNVDYTQIINKWRVYQPANYNSHKLNVLIYYVIDKPFLSMAYERGGKFPGEQQAGMPIASTQQLAVANYWKHCLFYVHCLRHVIYLTCINRNLFLMKLFCISWFLFAFYWLQKRVRSKTMLTMTSA